MAKDAKGHGSNGRNTGTQGMRLKQTYTKGPHSAKVYANPEWGEHVVKFFRDGNYQPNADYHTDDKADAHATAKYQLDRYGGTGTIEQMKNKLAADVSGGRMMASDKAAASALSSGPKSAPAPINSGATGRSPEEHEYNRDLTLRLRNGQVGSGMKFRG